MLDCFPLRIVAFRGHFPNDMPFNYRKWNILAFRGRLMSLLSPRSLAYSICWDRLSFTASFFIRVNSINALTYSSSEHWIVDWNGKRPPAVEINSFSSYPTNTDLRTYIYFAPERLLGYSTDASCTSWDQEPPTESVVYFRSG